MTTTSHLDQNPLAIAAQVIVDGIMMTIVGTRMMKMRPRGIINAVTPSNLKEFVSERISLKVMMNHSPNKI